MECNCWWCGAPLIWQSDFMHNEVFGDTGDEEEDNKLVSILQCSKCKCFVYYVENDEESE